MGSIKEYQCSDQSKYINDDITKWCSKFTQLWERSDRLFGLNHSSDDFYRQPNQLKLPLLFYLGHLPSFAWQQFRHLHGVNNVVDALYDKLFECGGDVNVQTHGITHGHSCRLAENADNVQENWQSFSLQSVTEYKLKVRSEIINVLMNGNLTFSDTQTVNILNVALEHEMMHQETLSYLFVQLPIEALRQDKINETNLDLCHKTLPLSENSWIPLPGGQTSLGKPYNEETTTFSFGWDNEFPSESLYVSSFELQSHPVRIGDFLQFVLDDGYTTREWWDNNIFEWIIESNICYPALWNYDGSYHVNFVLQRNVPIESVLDHPVIVSQVEAKAYCRWLSHKTGCIIDLPTEAEWVYAMWDWSKCVPTALADVDTNFNFRNLHTTPIESCTDKKLQWKGSAFEWTSSVFRPFTGYRGSLPTYPGYSSDFFDDHHFVALGSSFATDSTLVRRTFRNWYQDTYRYAFTTFRCIKRSEHTDHPLTSADREKIITALSNVNHRTIPSKYFYDAHGSTIFEQITQLDEYYLYNLELKLLQQRGTDIKTAILQHSNVQTCPSSPLNVHFVELGCGDGSKVEAWLLPWLKSQDNVSLVYHPIDISQHAIDSLVQRLKQTLGETIVNQHVKPICSTFEQVYTQIDSSFMGVQVIMLLGSTVGNFSSFDSNNVKYGEDSPVMKFMRFIRSKMKVGDWLICGLDLCKDTKTMIEAYSDSKGITAAFNYNLLLRLNRELNFNFKITDFQHYATFNPFFRRMESWLISTKEQTVTDQHGFTMKLQPYEGIQTEVSTKYNQLDIHLLMKKNSLQVVELYQTSEHLLPYGLCVAQAI